MLAAEALRLAAIEALCPTASLASDSDFPTLAGKRVYDSRAIEIDELDDTVEKFTPAISIYTGDASNTLRGDVSDLHDRDCKAILELVAELAVAETGEGDDKPFTDAMAGDDPIARLVLAALVGQINRTLQFGEDGHLFRKFTIAIDRVDSEPYAIPQLGLRFQRTTVRYHCRVPQDQFVEAAGLPEPLLTLANDLPASSYAKEKLMELSAHFGAIARNPLASVDFADQGTDSKFMTGEPPTP